MQTCRQTYIQTYAYAHRRIYTRTCTHADTHAEKSMTRTSSRSSSTSISSSSRISSISSSSMYQNWHWLVCLRPSPTMHVNVFTQSNLLRVFANPQASGYDRLDLLSGDELRQRLHVAVVLAGLALVLARDKTFFFFVACRM